MNRPEDSKLQLSTICGLGRALLGTGPDIQQILEQLAAALTPSLSEGCSIVLMPASKASITITRGSSTGITSVAMPLSRSDLVRGTVTVSRDGGFDGDDLETITACVGYASLAIESALRSERTAHFQKQVLGIVGHDLRAPLGAISVGTELLEMDVENNPAAMTVVKRIDTSVVRMRRMIDQLLDLTRARLGDGIPVARSTTRLLPIIRSVVDELARTHATAKLEVVGEDITGSWDPDRLGQVVANLTTNALQYGLEGGPIVIELATAEGSVTITVHNTIRETPISPEALARLFEPDRRGAHDVRHNTSGLGLGLYLVSEIVRAHGGSISAVSAESRTSVRVVLPTG
jgi:signal transduction histidine kinase